MAMEWRANSWLQGSGVMPMGSRHDETGWLNDNGGQWVLRVEGGGQWQLDVGLWTAWRSRNLIGKRVRVIGKRAGFDLLDVDRIEAL